MSEDRHVRARNRSYQNLQAARDRAQQERNYDSSLTRSETTRLFEEKFGSPPHSWQLDVAEAMILGLDSLVIAGTGSGKTIPFMLPLMFDNTKKGLVVSPLKVLQEDQSGRFGRVGVVAAPVNEDTWSSRLQQDLNANRIRAVFTSPELAHRQGQDQPAKRRRKVPSRFLDAGDYAYEDDAAAAAAEPERKVARTSSAGRSRRQSTASEPSAAPAPPASTLFDDEDVEDARAAAARVEGEHDDARSEHSMRHSSPVRTRTKAAKGKASADPASSKKNLKGRANKRAVVMSDSEEEEAYMDTTVDVLAQETDEDDYMSEDEEKPAKKAKGKAKPAPKRTNSEKAPPKKKVAEGSEAAKGKKKASKKPVASPSKHDEPIIDVVGGSSPHEPTAASSTATSGGSKQDSATPALVPTPVPKKRLPTINKVKGAATSGVSTPTTPSAVAKKPTGSNADTRDLDLNDSSVYNQLFSNKKGASANSVRPDLEERRKELNRMRDEARAKRKAEITHSFDLQAQAEKIAQFEETLKNTQALYPNMVAGRWKQAYEENKRLQREQEQWAIDTAMKEEGEVM